MENNEIHYVNTLRRIFEVALYAITHDVIVQLF